jgi:hypothetical protein
MRSMIMGNIFVISGVTGKVEEIGNYDELIVKKACYMNCGSR